MDHQENDENSAKPSLSERRKQVNDPFRKAGFSGAQARRWAEPVLRFFQEKP